MVKAVEQADTRSDSGPSYLLPVRSHRSEVLFCIDVDAESKAEMRVSGPKIGRPVFRLDSIKQGLLFFVHAKLNINPDHRFPFCSLGDNLSFPIP